MQTDKGVEEVVVTGVQSGPPIQRPPCAHDSRRLDGWLDTHCMNCGADGYWREGSDVLPVDLDAHIHPSGKILLREKDRAEEVA